MHRPHSAEYFGVTRRYWWNFDFLSLMSSRWRLDSVRRALDVGCGIGHWTMVLSAFLPIEAEIDGVDREAEWVRVASEAIANAGSPPRVRFQQGEAERLPFPDESFDMVTCQTLLLHVADPIAVLTEMRRVLHPGGLLALVEPNNVVQSLIATSQTSDESVDVILRRVRFQLMCERGRKALGEGDFSLGDRVPAMVAKLGFEELQVFQSDKAFTLVPPYATEEQETMRRELLRDGSGPAMWPHEDARRYFLAAEAGTAEEFERLWAVMEDAKATEVASVEEGAFARPGGRIVYLISARKPLRPVSEA